MRRLFFIVVTATALGSCTTTPERAQQVCADLGFYPGHPSYSQCVMTAYQEIQQRRNQANQNMFNLGVQMMQDAQPQYQRPAVTICNPTHGTWNDPRGMSCITQ